MRASLGEGPFWDSSTENIHWIDLAEGRILRTDPLTAKTNVVSVGKQIGAVWPMESGDRVVAHETGIGVLHGEGPVVDIPPVLASDERCNDARPDACGRLWFGTTAKVPTPGRGCLYRLDTDWSLTRVLDGLGLPNGLGWSPDGYEFYLVDSLDRTIRAYSFDPEGGDLSKCRVLVRFSEEEGLPDGCAVDRAGHLWVAMWGGGTILELDADGKIVQRVNLPVMYPTSCAIGGQDGDTMYITSAQVTSNPSPHDLDGRLLSVEMSSPAGKIVTPRFGGRPRPVGDGIDRRRPKGSAPTR
ncbi:SMP-30/gluconolactonase/LRE family protein [Aeromicrobium sp. Root236]|uniref:SMP-30/gluconolactonase/LRE family protein n=1 Tax=Aeromicrobium sp. Root236 TaxID=1736498 RepID=UPI0009EA4867|nr:SMP-30/gluconolactonase/LRE family protein [Aeromicrobium sp. Root236]